MITLSIALLAALAQAANGIPSVNADNTAVANPPAPAEPNFRGYGVKGIKAATLTDMQRACVGVPGEATVQRARCDQLRRTMRTQPGNSPQ